MNNIIVTTSWDDGHKLDIKLARLLKKYDIKGTFYISPNNREFPKRELLNDKKILFLSQEFEIGAHTLTHPILTKVSEKIAKDEVIGSKIYLEQLIGKKVSSFAYPKGIHNNLIQNIIKQSGFKSARTIEQYVFNLNKNPYKQGTSLHSYRQYINMWRLGKFCKWHPVKYFQNMDWETAARNTFDYVVKNGGVYHLWGHSWLTENSSQWKKLERVLSYIGRRHEIKYLENRELLRN